MPFESPQKLAAPQKAAKKSDSWLTVRFTALHMAARAARITRTSLRVLGNIRCQFEVLRLMRHRLFAELLPLNPRFVIKFAADDYLLRGLSVAERKECFLYHYDRLREALPDTMIRRILHRSISILEIREHHNVYRVTVHLSRPWDKEGELSLDLELDGETIYVLSFSIVPGWIVRSEASEVILIARLQGAKGQYKLIRQATKVMNDVSPVFLLLASLQGFAEAFGVSEISGVSGVRQSAYTEERAEIFRNAYDDFFNDVGAVQGPENLYHCPIPIPEKPLIDVKAGHKLRTKEKRAFKRGVSEAVRRFFQRSRRTSAGGVRLEQIFELPVQLEL